MNQQMAKIQPKRECVYEQVYECVHTRAFMGAMMCLGIGKLKEDLSHLCRDAVHYKRILFMFKCVNRVGN
jgi:hypothetical protein